MAALEPSGDIINDHVNIVNKSNKDNKDNADQLTSADWLNLTRGSGRAEFLRATSTAIVERRSYLFLDDVHSQGQTTVV